MAGPTTLGVSIARTKRSRSKYAVTTSATTAKSPAAGALAGHGIAYKAWLDVAEDVRAGRLLTLFDDWHGESVPFNLLCPHRVQVSERVKVLQAFLRQRCEALRR